MAYSALSAPPPEELCWHRSLKRTDCPAQKNISADYLLIKAFADMRRIS